MEIEKRLYTNYKRSTRPALVSKLDALSVKASIQIQDIQMENLSSLGDDLGRKIIGFVGFSDSIIPK